MGCDTEESMIIAKNLLHNIGNMLFSGNMNAHEIGLAFGFMSRAFGARAPSIDISRGVWTSTARPYFHEEFGYTTRGYHEANDKLPEVEDLLVAHEGIDIAVIDWWLCHEEIVWLVNNHNKWADSARMALSGTNREDCEERRILERAIETATTECGL
jgi:hypothetical protein